MVDHVLSAHAHNCTQISRYRLSMNVRTESMAKKTKCVQCARGGVCALKSSSLVCGTTPASMPGHVIYYRDPISGEVCASCIYKIFSNQYHYDLYFRST